MEVSLNVICHFPLVAFSFCQLITTCLSVLFLGFIPPGTLYASWTWVAVSFPVFGKFPPVISSNMFSALSLPLLLL